MTHINGMQVQALNLHNGSELMDYLGQWFDLPESEVLQMTVLRPPEPRDPNAL